MPASSFPFYYIVNNSFIFYSYSSLIYTKNYKIRYFSYFTILIYYFNCRSVFKKVILYSALTYSFIFISLRLGNIFSLVSNIFNLILINLTKLEQHIKSIFFTTLIKIWTYLKKIFNNY